MHRMVAQEFLQDNLTVYTGWAKSFALEHEMINTGRSDVYLCKDILLVIISNNNMSRAKYLVTEKLIGKLAQLCMNWSHEKMKVWSKSFAH